ncbi:ABC transporter substrate-binding protein [Microvirga aerophila]|uniref:ABC transporter substrate-binding protein n=1 Tax=Microvirga aerophila TaxID=670291 RepID=A0A512BPZ9_9HYPH|nr:ABC transporter substrate-binding protein [Microvirga aerophila]GEO14038.1 ABC transporter substrate-binding protein [Microvirga aerophila]
MSDETDKAKQNGHAETGAGLPHVSRRMFNMGLLSSSMIAASGLPIIGSALAAPTRGGTVRLAANQQSTNDTFDSAKYVKGDDYIRGTSVFSYLTRLDEQGNPQPEVARSWEPNENATRWAFKIRPGIMFSDGTKLSIDDIAFSILRHKEEKVASSAKQLVGNIKSVAADGPDTMVIELETPDVDLPVLVGIFQFAIVKKGTYDFAKPIGTGPFVVKEFQPGIRTVLVRNPTYWKEGRPYIDQFEIFFIPDAAARANALLSGDVDMIIELRGSGIEEVAKSSNASVFVTPSTRYTAIQAAVDRAPSNNQDLNLALAYLVDRKRVLDTVLRGYGTIANDHPIGPKSPYFNSALPQRTLDTDKAKFHLQKSGVGQAKIEVSVSDGVLYSVDIGQLMQREASRAGLNLELRREPADSYWSAVAGKRPYFATNFHPRPTYNMLLNLAWRKGAVWNFSHYENDNLEKLIIDSRATLDPAKRKQQYDEIQAIIYNSGAMVLPCFLNYVDGVSNKIKGLTPIPVGSLGGFNFTDRIWLEG